MKVFVYIKNGNQKIIEVNNVERVEEDKANNSIDIYSSTFGTLSFNTKKVKTTIYQN